MAVLVLLAAERVRWIERFDTLDELPTRIRAFARDFNERWLLERTATAPSPGARDAPPDRHGILTAFTNQVSGEPGPAQRCPAPPSPDIADRPQGVD